MGYTNKIKAVFVFIIIASILASPEFILAQNSNSPNYRLENAEFSAGGEPASSANYNSNDTLGSTNTDSANSTNYNGFWGFLRISHPGVPGTPTLANTGGNLYNALDFVVNTGNNPSDANYAIAISSDNFTTTNYIQASDTVGNTETWQSYTAWGSGTGQRVTGLQPATTYKIKVKARFGSSTETGFSNTATAATASPTLSVSIAGVSLGTVLAGETTTISTTSTAMSFSTLPVGSAVVAAQSITVTTNATGGYTTTLQQDGDLRNPTNSIPALAASNASPAVWPISVSTGEFGYHTTDSVLCTGTGGRFSSNNSYAAATSTPTEVACNTTEVNSEQTYLIYKLQIGSLQQAGTYSNNITYITTAIY